MRPFLAVLVAFPLVAGAATPLSIAQSGYLLDAADAPITGTVAMTFTLYDDPDTGAPAWTGTCDAIVKAGYYTAILGTGSCAGDGLDTDDLPPGATRWLEQKIGLITLSPRAALYQAPASLRSVDADKLGGVAATSWTKKSELTTAGGVTVALTNGGTGVDASALPANRILAAPAGTSGAASFRSLANADLPATGVTAGTYKSVTVNDRGVVTGASNPTSLAGFGITDAIANAGGVPAIASGALSARPAAGSAGRIYVATDTGQLSRDTGSTWDVLSRNASDLTTGTLGVAQGGTGLTSAGASGSILASNGSGFVVQTPSALGLVPTPPTCTGAGKALQWSGTAWSCVTVSSAGGVTASGVVQLQSTYDATYRTVTQTIPWDATIPQSNEGYQLVQVTITPTNASSLLFLDAQVHGSEAVSTSSHLTIAVFRDSGTDAIAAATTDQNGDYASGAGGTRTVNLRHAVAAGSTTATTFTLRVGLDTGSLNLNGGTATNWLGGALASGLVVTEVVSGAQFQVDSSYRKLTSAVPWDTSIPQSNEGGQLAQLAIVPSSATSVIVVDGTVTGSEDINSSDHFMLSLFRDSGTDAIATATTDQYSDFSSGGGVTRTLNVKHAFVAGSTAPTTLYLRAGVNGGTLDVNGGPSTNWLGGAFKSSLFVTELPIDKTFVTSDNTFREVTQTIPWDGTVPQSNEGAQIAQITVTPPSTTAKILVDAYVTGVEKTNTSDRLTIALFRDSSVNALAAAATDQYGDFNVYSGLDRTVSLTHAFTPGTTSPVTLTLRAGLNSGTLVLNGGNGSWNLGGALRNGLVVTIVP